MALTVQLDIVSAEGEIFSGLVNTVQAIATEGELGIMPGHAPLITKLEAGPVRVVKQDGAEEVFYVSGGLLEVQPKLVSLLADTVLRARDIDEAAAEQAKEDAKRALGDKSSHFDHSKATAELGDAMARLRTLQKLRK